MYTPYRSATLLVNPAARGVRGRIDPDRIARYLRKASLRVELAIPDSAAGATEAAAKAAERGDDIVFAVGGDGSARDAALGLAGSHTALAAVPAGTVNIWAKETGLPAGVRAAIDAHLEGQTVRVDLGRSDTGSGFLLMASLGWDAEVTRRVSPGLKRRLGDIAYMLEGLRTVPFLRPTPTTWRTGGDQRSEDVAVMVISNTRLYGGLVRFAPGALADDGQLDIVALCPKSALDTARLSARLAASHVIGDSRVMHERAAEVVIETAGIPLQLDGDFAGETPVRLWVDPGALLVSVPAGPLPEILAASTRPPGFDT
ncbi:MAG: diacylglycerol/lipid kinase family protein [Hyphomicrobiales bacterium]